MTIRSIQKDDALVAHCESPTVYTPGEKGEYVASKMTAQKALVLSCGEESGFCLYGEFLLDTGEIVQGLRHTEWEFQTRKKIPGRKRRVGRM